MELHTWLGFFVACWLISLSPGSGAVASMATGMRYGLRYGLWNIYGLLAGILVLVGAAALGLSAVLSTSPRLFELTRWLGVAWLAWLGWQQLRAPAPALTLEGETRASRWQLFVRAFVLNSSNPKGYVFMLAVLPSFIDTGAPLLPQYLTVLLTLMLTDFVVMCGYTLLGRSLASWMGSDANRLWLQRLFGLLFVLAALALAGFGAN